MKEYFNIPNLMGYFRILMIPVFLVIYYNADTPTDYYIAFGVLIVSYLTDFFDGKIARRFNMVTEFGKALDPIADKLTQGAMAIAITFRFPAMIWFLILFICKEVYMGIIGLYFMKKKNQVYGARWYGKVCTALIDIGTVALLVFFNMSYLVANIIIVSMMIVMGITQILYIGFHIHMIKGDNASKKADAFSA